MKYDTNRTKLQNYRIVRRKYSLILTRCTSLLARQLTATNLELWTRFDLEPGLRPMSFHHDGVVAGVAVVDVADSEAVVAPCDADVVLGSVLQVETVLEPLRPSVRLGDFTLERRRLTQPRHLHVG